MTIEHPTVQYETDHSLAAMHIGWYKPDKNSPENAVEVGWAIAPGIYGDRGVHLFGFSVRNGQQGSEEVQCWKMPTICGWKHKDGVKHDLGESLNDIPVGTSKYFEIIYQGGKEPGWYVLYAQQLIGHFEASYWKDSFTSGNFTSWYGEVETRVVNALKSEQVLTSRVSTCPEE